MCKNVKMIANCQLVAAFKVGSCLLPWILPCCAFLQLSPQQPLKKQMPSSRSIGDEFKGTVSWLKYRVFKILAKSLLESLLCLEIGRKNPRKL